VAACRFRRQLFCGLLGVAAAIGQTKPGALDPREIYKRVEAAVVAVEAIGPDGKPTKTGTGFLISSDGRFLTNYHVISHSKQATVHLANGDAYDTVEVLSVDKRKDIALLKIQAVELPYLALGRSGAVEIGDTIYSVSNPLGTALQNTLSQGLVSGKRDMDGYRVLQVSAPISHGSSGGPIFNTAAEVVGVAAFSFEGGQSLNFAIPIDYARGMLSANNPQPLASVYEPEPPPEIQKPGQAEPQLPPPSASPTHSQTSVAPATIPPDMRNQISIYLERQMRVWTDVEAQQALGNPLRHRFAYDQNKSLIGDIYAYADPTRLYREFELTFDSNTKKLTGIFMYPWNLTWEQGKRMWGEDARIVKNPDGSRLYLYRTRRLNVLVGKDGKIVSFGVY
jgi:V8-like Glu-specific endopeptidase